jgi:hypothetical protein
MNYTFTLTAGDAANNTSGPATTSAATAACPDTQPPTTPGNLHEVSATTTSVTLGWTASTDNVGVTGYSLVQGTGAPTPLGAGATQTTVTGLTCGMNYTFTLTAGDAANNTSPAATTNAATAACAGGVTVTVDPATTQGTSVSNLSTQLVYHDVIEQFTNGIALFDALHMPMIRIHAGTDAVWAGHGPELPEGLTQGDWSFAELDSLVGDVYGEGTTPILNVRYAPNWMWTCTKPFTGQTGFLADTTYQTFGDYMARLVSYYNTGSMRTEAGTTITNPAGTSHRIQYWEIWNEPDLSNETPCAPASGVALTPAQYIAMWNVVAPKMRAVDPTIDLIGPTVANPNQPGYAAADDYLGNLMAHGNPTPNALSFHSYGYWDNSVTDKTLFDGDGSGPGVCCGGIPELTFGLQDLKSRFPSEPVYVTEENVNADWGDDPSGRPWGALGVAWGASAFRALVLGGGTLMNQYEFAANAQFGYIDDSTGTVYLPYWRDKLLARAFPAGSTIIASGSTNAGVETLALRRADGSIAVLVINRQVDSNTTIGGAGKPAAVTVNLTGFSPSTVTLTQIDAHTDAATGPTPQSLGAVTSIPVTFGGYGMAVIEATP